MRHSGARDNGNAGNADGERDRQGEERNAALRQEYIGRAAGRQGGGLKTPRNEKALTISRKGLLCLGQAR